MSPAPDASTVWSPARPVGLRLVLGNLTRGRGDPSHQWQPDGSLWRTSRTPEGPATLHLRARTGEVWADAWGPGADWAVSRVPELLGDADDPAGFVPLHPVVAASWRRHAGLRMPRTGVVLEVLVAAILEQKVTGGEAHRAWRELLWRYGEPAPGPGPARLRVPPTADAWRRIPSWEWHRHGVDGKRARTVVAAATVAARLEESLQMPPAEAERRLRAVPGVGVWTAAEVRQRSHGDADAVSVGDFHIPALVGWALVGRPVDDDGMLALLEGYRGHRGRAVRLIELSGVRKPKFGPRYSPQDMRPL